MIKNLYLDIDSVTLKFCEPFYDWFNEPYIPPTSWNDPFIRANFEEIIENDMFWLNLPKLSDPKDFELIKGTFRGWITAAPCSTEIRRQNLINEGFPDKPVYKVDMNESKVEICKRLDVHLMVDDKPQNFIELNRNGIPCLLFDRSYNQDVEAKGLRISSLDQLPILIGLENEMGFISKISSQI